MPSDLITGAGAGGGVGIVAAIATWFGLKQRIDRIEATVVYSDTCEKCEKGNDTQFKAISETLSLLQQSVAKQNDKLDKILINSMRRRSSDEGE